MSTATLPDTAGIYHAKLTDPDTAMQAVTSGSSVAIGQAASQPRALLGALAARLAAPRSTASSSTTSTRKPRWPTPSFAMT